MKKWIFPFARRAMFLIALLGSIVWLGFAMQPQDSALAPFPNTVTFREFYELEPNTVDVLFFGSSIGVAAFSPMELYNNYGITSYNLSSAEQSPPISYFWLQEALHTQRPKVVMLEAFFLFNYFDYYYKPLNTSETRVRQALDPMRWSPVKMNAIREICELDESYHAFEYYFPIIQYHDRWKYINAEELSKKDERGLMGYSPGFETHVKGMPYEPFERLYDDKLEMQPVMQQYLARMAELCQEEGIRFVIVKTPTTAHLLEKHNAIREFADQYGVDFIDFNESEVYYDGLDYWYEDDNNDAEHTNHWGTVKVMDYLGNYLLEECGLEPHEDDQWASLSELYQQRIEAGEEAALNEEE